MVHFARSGRPEIVVFGDDMQLRSPPFLYAGKNILFKADGPDRLKALRFAAREEDRQEACSTRVEDVIRTIVRLNGGYGDVLQAVQEAKAKECLASRVVIDALPRPGRTYRRDKPGEAGCEEQPERLAATPLAGMFMLPSEKERAEDEKELPVEISEEKPKSKGVFGKIGTWLTGK
jgi:hypothetical protein